MRFTQPETTQASQVEVPLGGLPLPVVALAQRVRPQKKKLQKKTAQGIDSLSCELLVAGGGLEPPTSGL